MLIKLSELEIKVDTFPPRGFLEVYGFNTWSGVKEPLFKVCVGAAWNPSYSFSFWVPYQKKKKISLIKMDHFQ